MKRADKPTEDVLLSAIRAKCRDCCGGSINEVRRCTMRTECALWPYRTDQTEREPKRTAREKQTSMFHMMEAMQCSGK